ncbi:MAG: GMP/IMP nucleotidase [Methylotetracoccus sp.]
MIDWERIQTVFLDMDGTLLDLNFDNHFWCDFVPRRYAENHGLSITEARARLTPRFRALEGKLEWYCLDYWSEALDLDMAGLKEELAGLIAVLPHVTEFLSAVRKAGKRLVLVTNAHPRSLSLKMDRTRLHAFFDRLVCSHSFGFPKEHADFWRRLHEEQPYDAHATMLVDDSLAVLRSARTYGIGTIVAVRRADSTQPPRTIDEFDAIDDFREIMPPC